jgi:hypothetical protein
MAPTNPSSSVATPTTNDKDIKILKEDMEKARHFSERINEEFIKMNEKMNEMAILESRMEMMPQLEQKIQRIQELEEQLGRMAQKPIKLAEPEKFNGDRHKLNGFLATMAIHLNINAHRLPDDTAKVSFVAAHFTGKAMTWFETPLQERLRLPEDQWNSETHLIFNSYDYFEQRLRNTFGEVDSQRVAEQRLQRLRQTKSASAYTSEFEQLASKVKWNEDALMSQYYEGLKENVRYELIRMDPPVSFSALAAQAIKLDDRLYLFNQEKKGRFNPGFSTRPDKMQLGADKKPKGDCYNCGKPGHMARECRSKKTASPRIKGDCYNCGKPGHMSKECRSKKAETKFNANKEEKKEKEEKSETKAKIAANREHDSMHWSACGDDSCRTHEEMKNNTGYWPKKTRLAATREKGKNRMTDIQEDEDSSPEESDETTYTLSASTVKEIKNNDLDDTITTFRNNGAEWVRIPGPATRAAPVEELDIGYAKKLRFIENDYGSKNASELYAQWKTGRPINHEFMQFRKWVENTHVLVDENPDEETWKEIAKLTAQEEQSSYHYAATKRWIPIEKEAQKARNQWRFKVLPHDDERLTINHPAHYEVAWASCISKGCQIHEGAKKTHQCWPARPDTDPIVQIIEPAEIHGWKKAERQDQRDAVTLEPGPLLPRDCVLGRPWYHCPAHKCPKHVDAKLRSNYWPKNPVLGANQRDHEEDTDPHIYKEGTILLNRVTRFKALVDSGATRNFIGNKYVRNNGIPRQRKEEPLKVHTLEGKLFQNITHETPCLLVRIGAWKGYVQFHIVELEDDDLVLGMPWLIQANPQIDWETKQFRFPKPKKEGYYCRLAAVQEGEQESPLPEEYQEFAHVFDKPEKALPEHAPWDHEIHFKEGTKIKNPPLYPLTHERSMMLKEYLDKNLDAGYMRPSTSPIAHPVLFVKKKGTTEERLCGDYRNTNEGTIKNAYPLPLIEEIQDRIGQAQWYTRLDIRNAYYQIRMKEGHEHKTAIKTKFGLFEYLVMPFGLTNAPATFQDRINTVLRRYLDIFVLAYLDDILIFSETLKDHKEHVRKVLGLLLEAKLYLHPRKCEFHVQKTMFLGFILEPGTLRVDPDKIKEILSWPAPTNVKEVQAFIGFCNFCKRFIPRWSELSGPLTELSKKGVTFEWNKAQQENFELIKQEFVKDTILLIWRGDRPCFVETDASNFAICCLLMQEDNEGNRRPVYYHSRKLTPAELNYDIHDKELLAVVEAFRKWKVNLTGPHETQVFSDHRNLAHFMTKTDLSPRQTRWALEMAPFNFKIIHVKGTENVRADALSRRPDYYQKHEVQATIFRQNEDGSLSYNHPRLAATQEKDQLKWLKTATTTQEIDKVKESLEEGIEEKKGLLYVFNRIYVPSKIRKEFVKRFHESPAHGHQGTEKTLERITNQYYFPHARKTVQDVLKECAECQRNKPTRHAPYGHLQPIEPARQPWKTIAMDFITKLPKSQDPLTGTEYDSIMVIIEQATRWTYFLPYLESSGADQTAYTVLRYPISEHGIPEKIISDRDPKFVSKFWKTTLAQLGIYQAMSTAYHPQTDGMTERTNQTVEQFLRCYLNYRQDNWVPLLPIAQLAYNTSIHSATGMTPFMANHGFEANTDGMPRPITPESEDAKERIRIQQNIHDQLKHDAEFLHTRMDKHYNKKHSTPPTFREGEVVWLLRKNVKSQRPSKKLDHVKIGPYPIEKQTGPVNYRLKLPDTMRIHPVFHVALLEKAPQNAQPKGYDAQTYGEGDPEEWEVKKVKSHEWRNGKIYYLIQWSGNDEKGKPYEDTWEPEENLSPETLEGYQSQTPSTPTATKDRLAANQERSHERHQRNPRQVPPQFQYFQHRPRPARRGELTLQRPALPREPPIAPSTSSPRALSDDGGALNAPDSPPTYQEALVEPSQHQQFVVVINPGNGRPPSLTAVSGQATIKIGRYQHSAIETLEVVHLARILERTQASQCLLSRETTQGIPSPAQRGQGAISLPLRRIRSASRERRQGGMRGHEQQNPEEPPPAYNAANSERNNENPLLGEGRGSVTNQVRTDDSNTAQYEQEPTEGQEDPMRLWGPLR